jgi:RimJ/RimL family protein N-acetyltransferase
MAKRRGAPILKTERLVLRAHGSGDAEACAAMWAEPAVVRYIGGHPFTREESWARLLRYAGHWLLMGYGYWALEEQASGRFVGEVGFAECKRELTPTIEGAPEIGWALASWAHGKGFATEAIGAVVVWGDANLESRRTVCMINPEHAASLHLAEEFGYREFARTTYKGSNPVLLERWCAS